MSVFPMFIIKMFIPGTPENFALVILLFIGWLIYKVTPAGQRDSDKKELQRDTENRWAREQIRIDRDINAILRDADTQSVPYTYEIGRHGNEALAIRYGIANTSNKTIEPRSNINDRNEVKSRERRSARNAPSKYITLRKVDKIGSGKYRVLLSHHRDREAIAVIEVGTEYVKTFYPLQEEWFDNNEQLETILKGNGSFSLKELATFHVQKAKYKSSDK